MTIVRPATPADVPAVLPMVRALCAMHEALDPERFGMLPDVVDRYAHWLPERAADPTSVFLVAEGGNAPVGFLIATTEESIPIYRAERFGFIHDVWVDPTARRHGVALALVQEACRRFAAMGLGVRLETASANEAARRAFAKAGFRASTVEMLRPPPPPLSPHRPSPPPPR